MNDSWQFEAVKIELFLPQNAIESIREALHQVGVGHIGNYDHCISISEVSGYWRPLASAQPYAGEVGEISYRQECKIEVNCPRSLIDTALNAIHAVHPYEEPLINVVPLLNHFFAGATAVAP